MAPAGSDMQMLPPTVAAFQILNDIRKQSMHLSNSGWRAIPAALEVVQFDDLAGRRDLQPCRRRRQCRPAELLEIDQRVGRDLRFGEQPGAAAQEGMAVAPFEVVERLGPLDLDNRIEIHLVPPVTSSRRARSRPVRG
jgi:hypothetical protein